jgi:hypothetical protein
MSAPSDCSICYDPVIDFPAPEATGSHRSSCGHLFHPKCIAKWHIRQEESTCPICRKVAMELEDCAIEEEESEDEEDEEDEEEAHVHGGEIRITRIALESLLPTGVTPGVEAELGFDEFGEVTISRYELERISVEQGGDPFSDAQWNMLCSVFPAEEDDEGPVPAAMAPLQLTFAEWEEPPTEADPTQRARALLANPEPPASVVTPEDREAWALVLDSARATIARHAAAERHPSSQHPCPLEFFAAGDIPPTYGVADRVSCDICKAQQVTITFYHCAECQFDVCAECFMPPAEVVHAPGPFDIEESPRFTLRRADIQRLLQTHGSMATMEEFFNEEDGEEHTLVVTMSLESLNARFASLGATPVALAEFRTRETLQITAFADGTRDIVVKQQRIILNPEEDPDF